MDDCTLFLAPDGRIYQVTEAPCETRFGVDPNVTAVVFCTRDGGWIGSVAIAKGASVWDFSLIEIAQLLAEARQAEQESRE